MSLDHRREWLEADGLGGFASGTESRIRTRRYHALLLVATNPPTGRVVLVNGYDAWVDIDGTRFPLTTQCYAPGIFHPDGLSITTTFSHDPWPHWTAKLGNCGEVDTEIFTTHGAPVTVMRWQLSQLKGESATLFVRPFLSGRDYHSTHHENFSFRHTTDVHDGHLIWRPYKHVPGIHALTNGTFSHEPDWYRNFLYVEEQQRGLDAIEDLVSPGVLSWDLVADDAILILTTSEYAESSHLDHKMAKSVYDQVSDIERKRRESFPSVLERSADAYIVKRGGGKTVVAGYPWFTDWGRDTFIALRGLCLATGRLADALEILIAWLPHVSAGMLPNRFTDAGEEVEYNAVDASLWFIIAVHDMFIAAEASDFSISQRDSQNLSETCQTILTGYRDGTRFSIVIDDDGLIAAGESGIQLTWMDAKAGDWVVTPRIGKPVEIQVLWLNALKIASDWSGDWAEDYERGLNSFRTKFWNSEDQCLYDVVDVDHRDGVNDARFRPNQIFAVGGLPHQILEDKEARLVVDAVEKLLWTPLGLRSLSPNSEQYEGVFNGGIYERDGAYHQGTVWSWLIGPFVEAWIRVHGNTPENRLTARRRFVDPLLAHMEEAGRRPHLRGGRRRRSPYAQGLPLSGMVSG